MEILAKTDYQDLYRITNGVLLIINKFIPIDFSNKTTRTVKVDVRGLKRYNTDCQEWLRILKEDYLDKYTTVTVKKDTVLYYGIPVYPIDDKSKWRYEIKTTGNSFGGNSDEIKEMLNCVLTIIS